MYLSATMQLYYNYPNETQVGVDEAGRGCLLGPVVAAAKCRRTATKGVGSTMYDPI